MKKEGFTKLLGIWSEEFSALLPPFEGMVLGKKTSILNKHAL